MGLYKEEKEEERRGEDRRRKDRRREDRRGKERRGEDRRRRKKRRRRRTLFWLLIIAFVSLVFSVLIGNISVFIEKFYNYKDESYRPTDTDRMKYESEKAKPVGKK